LNAALLYAWGEDVTTHMRHFPIFPSCLMRPPFSQLNDKYR
jgi:hypothetical protein